MTPLRTAAVAAGSLVAGYAGARFSGIRPLGGVVLLAGAGVCGREWLRQAGTGTTVALLAVYVAAFAGSHPLARLIGAWPSVLTVAAAVGAASLAATRRRVAATR
jgi:hypothetical protein